MICSECGRSVTDSGEFGLWTHVADRSIMCEDAEAIPDVSEDFDDYIADQRFEDEMFRIEKEKEI